MVYILYLLKHQCLTFYTIPMAYKYMFDFNKLLEIPTHDKVQGRKIEHNILNCRLLKLISFITDYIFT